MIKLKLDSLKLLKSKHILFRLMLWVAVTCMSLLFLPQNVLSRLALDGVVAENAHVIGFGLIIAAAYFFTRVLNFVLDEGIRHLTDKRVVETIEAKVKLLDPTERALLREFFIQGATTLTLPQNELAVKSLVSTSILEMLGNERHYAIQGPTADYKISMKARIYLNRDVLRLPAGDPSQEELQHLIKTRPTFIGGLVQTRKHAA